MLRITDLGSNGAAAAMLERLQSRHLKKARLNAAPQFELLHIKFQKGGVSIGTAQHLAKMGIQSRTLTLKTRPPTVQDVCLLSFGGDFSAKARIITGACVKGALSTYQQSQNALALKSGKVRQ